MNELPSSEQISNAQEAGRCRDPKCPQKSGPAHYHAPPSAGGESRAEFERDRGFVPRDEKGRPK